MRGRWYARFVGEGVAPSEVDADTVARRIDEHLHEREHPIAPDLPTRESGRIEKRAESIARNAPSLATVAREVPDDTEKRAREAAWKVYAAAGDIARAIRTEAEAIESDETPTDATHRRRWVGPDVAARELHAHWQAIFKDAETGDVLPAAEVRRRIDAGDTRLRALLAVHDEVRAVYRRRLKRHKRGRRDKGGGQPVSDVARTLPDSMARLRIVMDARLKNRDVNALIRLGRVIHYEAAEPPGGAEGAGDGTPSPAAALGDTQAHVLDRARWPDDTRLRQSRFWTSDGQAEIKANEAFVRVWHGVLALMHRTATDWVAGTAEGCHSFRAKPATRTGARLPPIGA